MRDTTIKKLNYKLSKKAKAGQKCSLPPALVKEIASYQPIVNLIVNETLNGVFKGRTYRTLDKFVSTFGPRIAGSDNLENAIDFMVETLNANNLENVHTEPVLVPKWVRGKEYSWVVKPHLEKLKISGLGSSIGTDPKGLWANGIVVNSFEELQKKKMEEVSKLGSDKPSWNDILKPEHSLFFFFSPGVGEDCDFQPALCFLRRNGQVQICSIEGSQAGSRRNTDQIHHSLRQRPASHRLAELRG